MGLVVLGVLGWILELTDVGLVVLGVPWEGFPGRVSERAWRYGGFRGQSCRGLNDEKTLIFKMFL